MWFDESASILHIRVLPGAEMTLDNIRSHYILIEAMTLGRPYKALVDSREYYHIDMEALSYAASLEALGKRRAAAHYGETLANRLTTSFFTNNMKPPIPVRHFATEAEALDWLNETEL